VGGKPFVTICEAKIYVLCYSAGQPEYEHIITPLELQHIWIMALPLPPISTTIEGKITTSDQLPLHLISLLLLLEKLILGANIILDNNNFSIF